MFSCHSCSDFLGESRREAFIALSNACLSFLLSLLLLSRGKRPLGRPRRMWVDNIRMDLREIGWDGMDWIDLAQDRDQ
jgi:hypothetical protein